MVAFSLFFLSLFFLLNGVKGVSEVAETLPAVWLPLISASWQTLWAVNISHTEHEKKCIFCEPKESCARGVLNWLVFCCCCSFSLESLLSFLGAAGCGCCCF
ncbi:hypothetical protein OIU76_007490 [Salix suchowensis]|nr:hypothetical protein OIU76_007490 [Salix suchowensis]